MANGFDTALTLWNSSSQAEDLVATFYFAEGAPEYRLPLHLDAYASLNLDMAQLIASQQPDAEGRVIPLETKQGSVMISSPQGLTAPIQLNLNTLVFNVSTATCSYYCICCFGVLGIFPSPNPAFCPVGLTAQLTAYATYSSGNQVLSGSATWTSSNPAVATVSGTSASATVTGNAAGTSNITVTSTQTAGGRVCGYNPFCGGSNGFSGSGPANVLSVSQSPSSPPAVDMSTGDTKQITVTVNGTSGLSVSTSFAGTATTNNPNSSCTATLTIPGTSGSIGTGGSVSLTSNVTASAACASPSGIFSAVQASAQGVNSNNTTTYNVPPQVLIQMMEAEAGGTGNTTLMQGLGDVAFNRMGSSIFRNNPPGSNTTYQNTIVSGQFATTVTATGIEPELDLSVNVFAGFSGIFCNSLAFWTPTAGQWQIVQGAISSGTTTFPTGTGAPTYDPGVWPTQNQQILNVSTVGMQGSGAPNFLFLASRASTQPAAVSASCSP